MLQITYYMKLAINFIGERTMAVLHNTVTVWCLLGYTYYSMFLQIRHLTVWMWPYCILWSVYITLASFVVWILLATAGVMNLKIKLIATKISNCEYGLDLDTGVIRKDPTTPKLHVVQSKLKALRSNLSLPKAIFMYPVHICKAINHAEKGLK